MTKTNINNTAEKALDFGRNIFWAGLGSVSLARQKSGLLFQDLVSEGKSVQSGAKKDITKGYDKAQGRIDTARAELVKRIEKLNDDSLVAIRSVRGKLGIPGSEEISELARKVEELSQSVDKLARH